MVGAVTAFSAQDMAIKWLSGGYALHQIVFIRALIAITLTLGIFVPLEGGYGNLRSRRLPLHLLRALMLVIANMTFFTGLSVLPLGEATAIFFVAPILITALSVPLLGEKVGPVRWLAVTVGLCGVLIMLQPGAKAFQWATLLPLAAAFAYAMLQILTRKIGIAEKASTMAFYIQVSFITVSAAIGLAFGDGTYAMPDRPVLDFLLRAWIWPPSEDLAIMVVIGCLNAVGGYLISQGYRVAEAGLVAPFEYVALPMAVAWGVLVWGEWPALTTWIGILIIAGCGLFIFYRETRVRRK